MYTCRNYLRQTKFSWAQLTHENITQQINFMTKLSRTNTSWTTVTHTNYTVCQDARIRSKICYQCLQIAPTFHFMTNLFTISLTVVNKSPQYCTGFNGNLSCTARFNIKHCDGWQGCWCNTSVLGMSSEET